MNGLKNDIDKVNKLNTKPQLFDNQILARDQWFENGKKGIFAMATGTGKTFTSLGCLDKLLDNEEKLITIISSPYMHLVQQWKKSIESFGISDKVDYILVVDSSNPKGKEQMLNLILDLSNGYLDKLIILTTHESLHRDKFTKIIKDNANASPYFFIGDEMHGLGSYRRFHGLLSEYDYRLGLSATPEKIYDEFGTKLLFDYFGDIVYSFSLKEALNKINPLTNLTYLTPYNYYPYFVNLEYDEVEEYYSINRKISIECHKKAHDRKKIEKLLFKRANIIKNAYSKFETLDKILTKLEEKEEINNLIIYCNERQMSSVLNIAGNKHNLSVRKFTMEEGTKPEKKFDNKSEREMILNDFVNGKYQCLVAMHCLDEGVDVPSAKKAILMCNSNNPREFIQRLGRVLRRSEYKNTAEIYDIVIKNNHIPFREFDDVEETIYKNELNRCQIIGESALNNIDVIKKLY